MNAEPTLPDIGSYLAQMPVQEAALMELFSRHSSLVIFDIGACEGEDSIRYGRRFPKARIFSFEPLPSNQRLIRANFEKYRQTNAELIPLALSDTVGSSTFHISSGKPADLYAGVDWNYGNKSSSLLPPAEKDPMHGWIEFKEAITVSTSTLAHFCAERELGRIDFVHLDVQGAELMVLTGAGEKLRDITAVWLEVADRTLYRGQPLRPDIQNFMRSRGFRLVFESSQHAEGDQFYVNLHHPRVWPWLLRQRCRRGLQQARFIAGGWKSRIRHLFFPS